MLKRHILMGLTTDERHPWEVQHMYLELVRHLDSERPFCLDKEDMPVHLTAMDYQTMGPVHQA